MVWDPWDADDDERAALRVVRDQLPESARPAVLMWLRNNLTDRHRTTSEKKVNLLRTALRIDLFGGAPGNAATDYLVDEIERLGDKTLLRVVDYVLSAYGPDRHQPRWVEPAPVAELRQHLNASASALDVVLRDDAYRLTLRLPEGVEEAAQIAVDRSSRVAGQHLRKAIRETQGLEADTSKAMTEAIRAVEAAAGAVVTPKDKSPQLSKIVAALRSKRDWHLVLDRRDDDYPDHRTVLLGMMETLAFAQRDRHSGVPPTEAQARAHVMLAATLVGWFATDAVAMDAQR